MGGGSRRSSGTSSVSDMPSEGAEPLDTGDDKTLVCLFMYSVKLSTTTRGVRTLATGPAQEASGILQRQRQPFLAARKATPPSITAVAFCPSRQRLYYGQSSGELCFWPLSDAGTGTSRFVGAHKGPISCICIPPTQGVERSPLSAGGLFLSGSVGGDIKIWDYQGKVTLEPTVVVQTLHGHSGTITSVYVYGSNILSSSTDGTVRVWKAVEGRGQLLYPWYDLQAVVATVSGWARSMTYDRSKEVGDIGAFFVSDESGSITRIIPNSPAAQDSDQGSSRGCAFVVNNQLPKDSLSRISSGGMAGAARAESSAIPCMHDHGVASVRFVGDWRLLLALCYDCCLRGYDTDTGSCKFVQMNENRCMFTSLEVDVNNSEVLAVDKLGSLFIFCMNTGELIASKKLTKAPIVQICAVLGRERYAVATEQDVSVWCVRHEHEYTKLRGGHTRAVVALYACSGDKSGSGSPSGFHDDPAFRVLSASTDSTMRVWDPYDMSCMRVIEHPFSEISAMTFHEARDVMVTGHDNGDVHLWDMGSGSSQVLRQHTNTVTTVLVVLMKRNEELLITTGYDGTVVVWDILNLNTQPPHMIAKFRVSGEIPAAQVASLNTCLSSLAVVSPSPHTPAAPRAAAWSPSTEIDAMASGGGSARPLPCSFPTSSAGVSVQPTALGSAAGPEPWSAQSEALPGIRAALDLEPEVLAAAFETRKKVIFTAGNDKLIKAWSTAGAFLGQHVGHTDAVACLALDANFLFSGSEDCTVRVWDAVPASSKMSTPLTHPSFGLGSMDASAGLQQMIRQQSGTSFCTSPLKVLHGHTRCVTALLTHPAAGYLFSCSLDGSLRVWDYVAGTVLLKYGHHEEFKCMALRADFPEVVVGTSQASVLRYSAKIPDPPCKAAVSHHQDKAVTKPDLANSTTHILRAVTTVGGSAQLHFMADEEDTQEEVEAKCAASKKDRKWRFGAAHIALPVMADQRRW